MTIQEFRKFWEKKDYRVHFEGQHCFVRSSSYSNFMVTDFVFSHNEILRSSEEDMDQAHYGRLFKELFD